jgi:hypothetical protein
LFDVLTLKALNSLGLKAALTSVAAATGLAAGFTAVVEELL